MPDSFLCFACGYPGLAEAPWENGAASDEICPSCGMHFGYDDVAGGDPSRREAVYRVWRRAWIEAGMAWWSSDGPPSGWNPEDQLTSVLD